MVSLGLAPNWFFQYGIALELIFAIITLFVAIYSFKIYRVSKELSIKLFGISFLLFSLAFFAQSALNIGILFKLSQNISALQKAGETLNLGLNALYAHMILTISGLVIMSTICFKTKSKKMLFLLLAVSIIPIFFSRDPLLIFFILSTIYLFFITLNYFMNYLKKKKSKTLIVFFAFLLLLISNAQFILAVKNGIFYVAAHFLILFAYILILINLVLVSRR